MNARQEWRNAVRDSTLDITAKAVALILDTYMDGNGDGWPSKATIGDGASCDSSTVRRALRRLEQGGFMIVIRSRGGRPNRYRATMPPPNGGAGAPVNGGAGAPVQWSNGGRESQNGGAGAPRTRSTELEEQNRRSRAQPQTRDPRPLAAAYKPFADRPPDIAVDELQLERARAWLSEHRL